MATGKMMKALGVGIDRESEADELSSLEMKIILRRWIVYEYVLESRTLSKSISIG